MLFCHYHLLQQILKHGDINYLDLKEISIKNKAEIPLLSELLKASRNKFPLLLELKPIFSLKNLKKLLLETKKCKKCALISFQEKNIYNLAAHT